MSSFLPMLLAKNYQSRPMFHTAIKNNIGTDFWDRIYTAFAVKFISIISIL